MVASFTSLKFYIAHVHCNSLLCHGKQDQVTDSLTFWYARCELTHHRFLSSMNSKRHTHATWLSHPTQIYFRENAAQQNHGQIAYAMWWLWKSLDTKSLRRAPLIPRTRCGACAWLQCMQVLTLLAKKLTDQLLNLPKKNLGSWIQRISKQTKLNPAKVSNSKANQDSCILHKNIWALKMM